MSGGPIGTYMTTGDAHPGRVRIGGWLDGLAAAVLLMLAWPIPVLRATLSWSVHVPLILAAFLVTDFALRTVSMALWRRTTAMYLLDLGIAGEGPDVSLGRSARWAAGWTVALLPSLLGLRRLVDPYAGLPARLSGLVTRSTR